MHPPSSSGEVSPTSGSRRVPLKRVVPWWYIVGAIVTIVVMGWLNAGGTAVGAFWGPAIGLPIQDRLATAKKRQEQGLPVSRRDLTGPPWLEPVLAVLLTVFAVGFGLALGFVVGDTSVRSLWMGLSLAVTSGLGALALIVVRRKRPGKQPPAHYLEDVSE